MLQLDISGQNSFSTELENITYETKGNIAAARALLGYADEIHCTVRMGDVCQLV
jgi:hypothetical protein